MMYLSKRQTYLTFSLLKLYTIRHEHNVKYFFVTNESKNLKQRLHQGGEENLESYQKIPPY